MPEHKLYFNNFDPDTGSISFSIEDNNGNQITVVSCMDSCLKNLETMDYFLICCFPKYLNNKTILTVKGPVSNDLYNLLTPVINLKVDSIVSGASYTSHDLEVIEKYFLISNNLNIILNKVFKYFRQELSHAI